MCNSLNYRLGLINSKLQVEMLRYKWLGKVQVIFEVV